VEEQYGTNYYYKAERNWRNVYNNKDELLDLCNKWEQWEPEDKSRKNPIRTYWWKNEEEIDDMMEEEPVEWWEQQNLGYTEESDAEPDFYWDADVRDEIGGDNDNYEVNEEGEHQIE
jgi:hypothetical protein